MQPEVNYSGNKPFRFGAGTEVNESLANIFSEEVGNAHVAWYIDYYIEDPEHFQVSFLAGENDPKSPSKAGNTIMMTNENKDQRNGTPEGQWPADTVASWFTEGDIEHRWLFIFQHPTGELFGIHAEANRIFVFGAAGLSLPISNLWDDYVEDGIAGPLISCGVGEVGDITLHSIIQNPDIFGELKTLGLVEDYMMALAGILA